NKAMAGCAGGILNAPDPSFDPIRDKALIRKYGPEDHLVGKQENKLFLQKTLCMRQDKQAPLFVWPSRLDTFQKGCHLLSEIIYEVVSRYWKEKLQIVFVADGEFQQRFKDIVRFHNFSDRVAVCDFDERLSRLAYGASDFVLMPSLFEPCGLSQMIGPIYGALPVAHDTGGIHDTVEHMDIERETGNGFLFETFDFNGLFWAVEQAMVFYKQPNEVKAQQIKRIMNQSKETFNHETTAHQYIDLYEKMLQRPLINGVIPFDKAESPTTTHQKGKEVPDTILRFDREQEIESYETNQLDSGAHIKTQEEYCIRE
ncbi:MAG: glycosyltransferase, partial [Deltaproteobacteria bacterium]|nr:glycosyltransferase [Deltaproteobacteria bacterium]